MQIRKQYFLVVLITVFMLASQVSAAYPISQSDTLGYTDARTAFTTLCFYGIDTDENDGNMQVKGDHNLPYGPDQCGLDMVMRFQAPETGQIKMGASWQMSYKLDCLGGWAYGKAVLEVRYILYSDGYNGIETKTAFTVSCVNPWWSDGETISGTKSMSTSTTFSFQWSLQQGTYYRFAVQLYLWLDGEANAWSNAGSPNALPLDVNEIVVNKV
jgi:hypothetical protein